MQPGVLLRRRRHHLHAVPRGLGLQRDGGGGGVHVRQLRNSRLRRVHAVPARQFLPRHWRRHHNSVQRRQLRPRWRVGLYRLPLRLPVPGRHAAARAVRRGHVLRRQPDQLRCLPARLPLPQHRHRHAYRVHVWLVGAAALRHLPRLHAGFLLPHHHRHPHPLPLHALRPGERHRLHLLPRGVVLHDARHRACVLPRGYLVAGGLRGAGLPALLARLLLCRWRHHGRAARRRGAQGLLLQPGVAAAGAQPLPRRHVWQRDGRRVAAAGVLQLPRGPVVRLHLHRRQPRRVVPRHLPQGLLLPGGHGVRHAVPLPRRLLQQRHRRPVAGRLPGLPRGCVLPARHGGLHPQPLPRRLLLPRLHLLAV